MASADVWVGMGEAELACRACSRPAARKVRWFDAPPASRLAAGVKGPVVSAPRSVGSLEAMWATDDGAYVTSLYVGAGYRCKAGSAVLVWKAGETDVSC